VPPNAFRIPGFSAPTQIGTGARPSGRITVRISLVSGQHHTVTDCATRKRRKRRAPAFRQQLR